MKRKYEIGFIVNPEATEEETKKITDSVLDIIKKTDGVVEKVDEWGRRRLAYPIDKHNEGIYIFINSEMVGSAFFDIERRLKLHEKVMRFIVLRLDDRLRKANRLNKKWKRMEKSRKSGDNREDSGSRPSRGGSSRGSSRSSGGSKPAPRAKDEGGN
jgi:small subunit ribosomal protein S6